MPDDNNEETGALSEISRRRALATASGAVVGTAVLSGSASAHRVDTIAFCGCSQVTVWGAEFSDGYEVVLYCDGEKVTRDLTGSSSRLNYDVHEDDSIEGDCQIVAVRGTTWTGSENLKFTICNEHCPSNCATKGIEDLDLSSEKYGDCVDPSTVEGEGFGTLTVQCSGCGRDEPGHPGQGGGNGNKGRGGGNGNRGRGKGN